MGVKLRRQTIEDYVRDRWEESKDIYVRYGSRLSAGAADPAYDRVENRERTVPAELLAVHTAERREQ